MSRSERFLYIGATLIGMLVVLVYRGPAWQFVRGHVGDWLVVQLIYLIGRFWISNRRRYSWAGGVFLVGVLVEVIKFFSAGLLPHTFLAEITLGSTFDPLDLIAFALGLVMVLAVEQVRSRC